ncbi:major facilitator superfamily domain-containing protein 6-like isoform X3 [Hippoglossus hippoglossus]|uniref:major facilitator superfamily domain-containing protein 6-like isoform X3 n=1 Tax=Hippoglossus hippoglossus TaxID=8267 RepID=UPI00148B8F02|nr:major facilitator superfamily domain-containing protein 6-like isoform X3 [Hippoglossus hippoglossus]
MKRNKQIDVKRALALASVFNFLCSCSKGCLLPFLTLYLRQLGLTPVMTGVVMGAKHLISLAWSPVASLLSKHYNKRRVVIKGSLVCSAAVALVLLLIPTTDVHTRSSSCNTTNLSSGSAPSLDNLLTSSIVPVTSTPPKHPVSHPGVTFPAKTIADTKSASVMTSTTSRNQRENVSVGVDHSLREPGISSSVGPRVSGSSAPAVRRRRSDVKSASEEPQREKTTEEQSRFDFLGNLKVMDPQHQLFFLILIIVSVWESVSAPLEWTADDGLYEYLDFADASDRYTAIGPWGLLGAACGAGGAGLLVSQLSCLIAGAAGSAVDNFLLWQMQDHGSNELHMGSSLALALLSQAAFPLLAGRVSKLLRPGRVLAVGAAALGLQCLYYSFLWGPWAVLPVQMLSCFSGGALWWAVNVQCEDVATPEAERSVRRVFSALSLHLGSSLGSLGGGFVVQRFGLAWLFRAVAAGLMLWCVCLMLLQWKAPHQRRINYSRLLAANASEASDSESEQERDWLDKAMETDRSNNNYGRRINH